MARRLSLSRAFFVVVARVCLAALLVSSLASAQAPDDGRPSVTKQLRDAFTEPALARLSRSASPGADAILLEMGSVLHTSDVLEQDGKWGRRALERFGFAGAYGDLVRSRLPVAGDGDLLAPEQLFARAQSIRERRGAIPIVLAVVDYSTYGERAVQIGFEVNGRAVLPDASPEQRLFVAATVTAEVLPSWNPRLLIDRDLVVGRPASQLRDLAVKVNGGPWQRASFGVPLELDRERFRVPARDGRDVIVAVRLRVDGEVRFARTRIEWHQSRVAATPAMTPDGPVFPGPSFPDTTASLARAAPPDAGCPVLCYDMPSVTARFPYPENTNQRATINPRIYPSAGVVVLENGQRAPKLRNVVVAIDGFDAFNTRTQDDLWSDFSRGFLEFLSWGYDLVVVDYANGRDYLPKNGYAVRELITEVIPQWRAEGFENSRFIVVGGSMGTQTGRWALRTAELGYPYGDPEDHGVGLFVAVDGPFHGASIPIGLQAIADFLKEESSQGVLFEQALNSPAARTLMPRTRRVGAKLPRKRDYKTGNPLAEWYVPDPQHVAYYSLVDQPWFGLPRTTRNATVASGSGTGSLQIPGPQPGWLPTAMMNRVFKDNIIVRVNIWAQTDHDGGHIFHGHLRKFLSSRTRDLLLGPADWVDVAPGDRRFTPLQIANAWNGEDDPFGFMEAPMPFHSFTHTTSALNTPRDSTAYFVPADDPDIEHAIPFDSFTWAKCNLPHVDITNEALAFVKREFTAFLAGDTPQHPALYSEPCDQPEPVDRCLAYVDWFQDPNAPEDVEPWYDGANCFVRGVPSGERGFISGNAYWVERWAGSCRIGIPGTAAGRPACFLGEAPSGMSAFLWGNAFYYDGFD